jgi:hypothetical protein
MRQLAMAGVAVGLVVLAGCNGGSGVDPTAREISDAELAAMVLQQEDLGPAYGDFTPDEYDWGFKSNEAVIEDYFGGQGEAEEDIQRFGRINGYVQAYVSLDAVMEAKGMHYIGTAVDLLEDQDGASGYLKEFVEDVRRQVGTTSDAVTLEDAEEFEPGGVGNESAGLLITASNPYALAKTSYVTMALFRRGRLLGYVAIGRYDAEDVREEVAALAQKLDERIVAVLRGETAHGQD